MGRLVSGAIRTLQQTVPFTPNLFQVEFFHYTTAQESSRLEAPSTKIYCTGYELPVNALVYERNFYTKEFLPKEIKLSGEVTIHWIDTENLDVWNFHQRWFANFYNRAVDAFVVGPTNKKLDAKIIIHDQKLLDNTVQEEAIHTIELFGITPITAGFPLKGSWDEGADWPKFSIKYNADRIEIVSKGQSKRMI